MANGEIAADYTDEHRGSCCSYALSSDLLRGPLLDLWYKETSKYSLLSFSAELPLT